MSTSELCLSNGFAICGYDGKAIISLWLLCRNTNFVVSAGISQKPRRMSHMALTIHSHNNRSSKGKVAMSTLCVDRKRELHEFMYRYCTINRRIQHESGFSYNLLAGPLEEPLFGVPLY